MDWPQEGPGTEPTFKDYVHIVYRMTSIITPPVRPGPTVKTRWGGRSYYTIHVHPNNAFSVRLNEDAPTAIISFKSQDHAVLLGKMVEAHYMKQKEWPDTTGRFLLPLPQGGELAFLFIRKWDFEELKMTCTKNFLSMVSVDDIENTKTGFRFDGKIFTFEASREFHIESLTEMYDREGPMHDP